MSLDRFHFLQLPDRSTTRREKKMNLRFLIEIVVAVPKPQTGTTVNANPKGYVAACSESIVKAAEANDLASEVAISVSKGPSDGRWYAKVRACTSVPAAVIANVKRASLSREALQLRVVDLKDHCTSLGLLAGGKVHPALERVRCRLVVMSTADLPAGALASMGIANFVIPARMSFGQSRDGTISTILEDDQFDSDAFYDYARAKTPKITFMPCDHTKAASVIENALLSADEVLVMSTDVRLSRFMGECSRTAIEKMNKRCRDRIVVHDTSAVGGIEGMMVLKAAKLASRGMSAASISKKLVAYRSRCVNAFWVTRAPSWMRRARRISRIEYRLSHAGFVRSFALPPSIDDKDRAFETFEYAFGCKSHVKLWERSIARMEAEITPTAPVHFMLQHNGRPDRLVFIEELLRLKFTNIKSLTTSRMCAVLGVMLGPGARGIVWALDDDAKAQPPFGKRRGKGKTATGSNNKHKSTTEVAIV